MPSKYHHDVRKQALEHIAKGEKLTDVSRSMDIPRNTLYRWRNSNSVSKRTNKASSSSGNIKFTASSLDSSDVRVYECVGDSESKQQQPSKSDPPNTYQELEALGLIGFMEDDENLSTQYKLYL